MLTWDGLRLQPEAAGQVRGKFRLDRDQKFDWAQLNISLFTVEERGSEFAYEGAMGIPETSV